MGGLKKLMGGPQDLLGIFDEPKQVAINPPTPAPTISDEETPERVMPVSDDEAVKRARRRAIARRRSVSGGRASTILTSSPGGGLGG